VAGFDRSVLQIKTKNVICHTADTKLVKQEVNGTVIEAPVLFVWHHNTQYNETRHNGTQHDNKSNKLCLNDSQHYATGCYAEFLFLL